LNLNQSAFARLVGVSSTYIQKIENGEAKRPSYDVLRRLGDACNRPIEYFAVDGEYSPAKQLVDESDVLSEVAQRTQKHDPVKLERLLRILDSMTPEQRELYLERGERLAALRREEEALWAEIINGSEGRSHQPLHDEKGAS
jgi:transcriptional regulator with XRE-family HTH domain